MTFITQNINIVALLFICVATVGPKMVRKLCSPIERCGSNEIDAEFDPLFTNFGPGNGQLTGICCTKSGCNDKTFNGMCITPF